MKKIFILAAVLLLALMLFNCASSPGAGSTEYIEYFDDEEEYFSSGDGDSGGD